MIRLAHATDIHWFAPPAFADLTVKRLFGSANLYLRGRRHDFDPEVQRQLVAHLGALDADVVLITGDLTAQALVPEFEEARRELQPLLDRLPVLLLPGNHDVYAPDAVREGRFRAAFGPWMGGDGPLYRLDHGDLTVLGLDPCRPTLLTAAGEVPAEQKEALRAALADPSLAGRTVVLALHYPIVDREGQPYVRPSHGLLDAPEVIALLDEAPVRPALICCGHVHHRYRAAVRLSDGSAIPLSDCGSSGQAWQPSRGRYATCAAYDLDHNEVVGWHAYEHDGTGFVERPSSE